MDMQDAIYSADLRNRLVPCGDCSFEESEQMSNVEQRLHALEKMANLRLEEDARMAERFDSLRKGQEEQARRFDALQQLVMEVRDIAMKNSVDLNNGIKSEVKQIRRAVVKNREELGRKVDEVDYERDHPSGTEVRKQTKKHRLEILAFIIIPLISVGGTLLGSWLFGG
jgi:hypothetical protein